MEPLVWLNSYNTDIEEIDTQHKQIVEYLNQLYKAGLAGNNKAVGEVIEGLVDYTLSHFAFEEDLMEKASYPFASAHKNIHNMFIKRVGQFQDRFKEGEDVSEEFYAVLRRWLINHIQRDDAAYTKAVKALLSTLVSDEPSAADESPKGSWLSRSLKKFF